MRVVSQSASAFASANSVLSESVLSATMPVSATLPAYGLPPTALRVCSPTYTDTVPAQAPEPCRREAAASRSDRNRQCADRSIDRALPEHSRADVDDRGLTGRDTVERFIRNDHELIPRRPGAPVETVAVGRGVGSRVRGALVERGAADVGHGRNGVGVSADLHLAVEGQARVIRRPRCDGIEARPAELASRDLRDVERLFRSDDDLVGGGLDFQDEAGAP